MPPSKRNTQIPDQVKTGITGDAEKIDRSTRVPTDQYHHFIPRFILRRFQVVSVKSRTERQKGFRSSDVDPEYVHYYDIATSSLDNRLIGEVYGAPNLYQDNRNTENINELEEKLADLERQASSIIEDMHRALLRGTFTLKRTPLELLRKYLFVMHYFNVACSNTYFQVDHPENARGRQWVECFMKAKGIRSTVKAWLYFLKYYLDTSHSDIMKEATELIGKYSDQALEEVITGSHIPLDIERFPALSYHTHTNNYFLSIWRAAEWEEFILTHNGFGLWEGLAGNRPGLHHIFVVSPRIAIVLCSTLLRPELKGYSKLDPLKSSLLYANPTPPTQVYPRGESSVRTSLRSLQRYRSSQEKANDSFVFKITKLSRPQTLELNSVVLVNVQKTGSLTFLSRACMLRTVRAFQIVPSNFPQSELVAPLITHLSTSVGTELSALHPSLQPLATPPDENIDALSLVDIVLYVLLMQICTGYERFPSAYDRAHVVLKIMEKAKPTLFAHEISQEAEIAFQACKADSEDVEPFPEDINFPPLLSSIPDEVSSRLFDLMIPYMRKLGAVMSGGEWILEELQNEVVVVSFLTRAACDPGVWHTLSYSSTAVPKILAKLFEEGTPADDLVESSAELLCLKATPTSPPCYDRAYTLRRICGMNGPTTNLLSQSYYELTAAIIRNIGGALLNSLQEPYSLWPSESPHTRIVRNLPKKHSDSLLARMKMIISVTGYTPSPGDDNPNWTLKKWLDEMAIVNALAWLGRHRRNLMGLILDGFPAEMGLKLYENE